MRRHSSGPAEALDHDHVTSAYDAAVGSIALRFMDEVRATIDAECCVVESPIERAFLYALFGSGLDIESYGWAADAGGFELTDSEVRHVTCDERLEPARLTGAGCDSSWLPVPVEVWPQVRIGSYRVDFLLSLRGLRNFLVVELDGHDFHERTKEQARHDRRRDRYMTARGLMVFRFTGSEIYRDVAACVGECIAHFWRQLDQRSREAGR